MNKDVLAATQKMDQKLLKLKPFESIQIPKKGWINEIRNCLNITTRRLGKRCKKPISAQAIIDIERSEQEGTISLNTLHKIASAMNMKVVYGFVPIEDSLTKQMKNHVVNEMEGKLSSKIEKKSLELDALKVLRNFPSDFWDK